MPRPCIFFENWACGVKTPGLIAAPRRQASPAGQRQSGRSSGVEHNLAKVGVEGSNPFARSSFQKKIKQLSDPRGSLFAYALSDSIRTSAAYQ